MATTPEFDLQEAHKYFSTYCFNSAWEYIDKPNRSAEETDTMIHLAQASLWHWTRRNDHTDRNLSVGYWQLARVYALAGKPVDARHYGQLSLDHSQHEEPFYKGYAYEALARAEALDSKNDKAKEYLAEARKLAQQVSDPEWQKLLVDDLENITLS